MRIHRSLGRAAHLCLATILALGSATVVAHHSVAAQQVSGTPGQEGLKVHGHWTIEIRRPDGSMVGTHEFENALTTEGRTMLASILSRQASVTGWHVWLQGTDTYPSPCGQFCVLTEGFALSVATSTEDPSLLVLTGTVTAPNGGYIGRVSTRLNSYGFTNHQLATSIPITEGQIIQVKVVISFS